MWGLSADCVFSNGKFAFLIQIKTWMLMHDKWIANTSSNKSVIADSGSRIYGGNNAVQYNSHFREKSCLIKCICVYM